LPEEEEDAEETAMWLRKAGRNVVKLPADVRDEGVCQSLVERMFDELGDFHILVNNAAFQATHDSIAEFTTEEFDRTFKTNVYATFWLSKAALGRMLRT
jgi:NAD(P)-dependent dehydrogenase (short-subunit alcohol dehydrogenase family)